jgi:xanthine dehydrogenase accessory factor
VSVIWIQGAGEQASGIAWRLVRSGYRVVAAETERPTTVRRLVSFSEAVYAGRAEVEGIPGVLRSGDDARPVPGEVTVVVDPRATLLEITAPAVVIDARLTKRTPKPLPHGPTPLVGIGPGFVAGRDADLVVETHRTARPGLVISDGGALPPTGIPGDVGGETLRRVLRAPCAGRMRPRCELGDLVAEGDIVAEIGGRELRAPFAGRVRGMIHPSVELTEGMKVGDVDPRGEAVDPFRISDKALAIGGGVLEALLALKVIPTERGAD